MNKVLKTPSPMRKRQDSDLKTEKKPSHSGNPPIDRYIRQSIAYSKKSIDILRSKDFEINKLQRRLKDSRSRSLKSKRALKRLPRFKTSQVQMAKQVIQKTMNNLTSKINKLKVQNKLITQMILSLNSELKSLNESNAEIQELSSLNEQLEAKLRALLGQKFQWVQTVKDLRLASQLAAFLI